MTIDKTKPVMVTGANGYVASWLIKKLLDEGVSVHAAVRNPEDDRKVGHLKQIAQNSNGKLKFFKGDLLLPGSYKEAMEECEIVFHTASPFTLNIKDAQKELIDPAKLGTRNVLQTVNETASVKRVVVTSSCAAIYTDAIDCKNAPNGEITEEMWNTTSSLSYQPYSYSKTLAEKEAWEIAKKQDQWDLVTINPSFVMGPPLNPHATTSESFSILKQLGDGTLKMGVPNIGVGIVDVRDVAEAHFKAGFTTSAKGRYITSGHNSSFLQMATSLQSKYSSKFPIPKKALPKWLAWTFGPMLDKSVTRKFISNNVNIEWKANNTKIKKELEISFRPLETTMQDGFQTLIDEGILKPKK